MAFIDKGTVFENTSVVLVNRLREEDTGELLDPTDFDHVAVSVYDQSNESETNSFTLAPGDTLYAELQTPENWKKDSEGFNFKIRVPGASFPNGGTVYRVEVSLVYIDPYKEPLEVVWQLSCLSLYSK